MMTLRKRLANQIALMCGGVLLLGIAAVAGVRGLRQDFSIALRANQELRDIYTVGLHVGNAREELADTPPDVDGSSRELHVAMVDFEESRLADDVLRGALLDALKNPADARRIDRTYTALVDFSANIREQITQRQSAADRKFHLILATVALLATAVMCTAIFVGVKQYRSVMRPLGEIQSAVRRFASGEFTQRVVAGGDAEFVSLASDFNRMADELAALYGELENRVQTKSRQLVQSERLASLGYLAAGVAHE
ncbi:MAG TPA: HAMP domain-containing protein, partial [Tepidisphaeraceae bacterium]